MTRIEIGRPDHTYVFHEPVKIVSDERLPQEIEEQLKGKGITYAGHWTIYGEHWYMGHLSKEGPDPLARVGVALTAVMDILPEGTEIWTEITKAHWPRQFAKRDFDYTRYAVRQYRSDLPHGEQLVD